MAKRASIRFLTTALVLALVGSAQAAPRRKPTRLPAPAPAPSPAPAPAAPAAPPAPAGITVKSEPATATSEFNWRQVVVAPRLAGDLRAFAIDPLDPNKMYIGTRGGTIVRTVDGGVTWDEIELTPFLYRQRLLDPKDTAVRATTVIGTGANVIDPQGFRIFVRRSAQADIEAEVKLGSVFTLPGYHYGTYAPTPLSSSLFTNSARNPPTALQRVNRVVACPSAEYALLVATPTAVLGSSDGGNTWVQLHFGTEQDPILNVACSPANPSEVIITTASGPFVSVDGGNTFNILEGPLAQGGASAIHYGQAEGARMEAFLATGRDVWMGDLEAPPDSPNALHVSTPGDERPVVSVEWIATSNGAIWLATGNGARVSRDHGKTWESLGPELLEGYRWTQIAVQPGEAGQEQVAVLNDEFSMISHDGGKFWEPFFPAVNRRALRQLVANSAGFWLLTGNELWTTAPRLPMATTNAVPVVGEHARRRLRQMPPFDRVLNGTLDKAGLSSQNLEQLLASARKRAYMPRFDVASNFGTTLTLSDRTQSITDPTVKNTIESKPFFNIQGVLTWDLPDIGHAPDRYRMAEVQKDLHALRNDLVEIVEDAYNERVHLLQELSGNTMDLEQQLITNARVEWLDALLGELGERAP